MSKFYKNYIRHSQYFIDMLNNKTISQDALNEILESMIDIKNFQGIELILEKGADPSFGLETASCYGYLDIVEYLMEKGADVHAYNDAALRYSAVNGHLDVVKYLVKNGANINIDVKDVALVLVEVVMEGHFDILKYLIENGADIHLRNDIVLYYASRKGDLETVKYLVDNGANINAYNVYVHSEYTSVYTSALIGACENDKLDIVKYLVEKGADIHIGNDYVLTGYYYNQKIAEYLKSDKK
jgi:ankyrin repeat protein